jgi:NADH:ubiquinone oxidoreductase subunit B-like Fe-S oxidoreductase
MTAEFPYLRQKFKEFVAWGRKNALRPDPFGTAC